MFSKVLKDIRIKKGLKQHEVASALNIARSTYAGYETNKRLPDIETVKKIADLFEISIDVLLDTDYSKSENDFLKEVDLSDEELLRRYSFTFEGKEISEVEVKRLLKIIRALEDD